MGAADREELIVQAGEYVLGTLDAQQAQAFEAQLRDSDAARRELAYWEQRLAAMGLALAPVPPPAQVWAHIAAGIGHGGASDQASDHPAAGRRAPTRRSDFAASASRGRFWPGLAIAASVAALVMAALLFTGATGPSDSDAPAYASVVHDEPTGMSWLVTAPEGAREMSVVAMDNYDVPEGKILRLWLKPEGHDPVLLGRWPHAAGRHAMSVSDAAARFLDQPAQLLVSMEDDSNAGKPAPASDGRVMWVSPLARRAG